MAGQYKTDFECSTWAREAVYGGKRLRRPMQGLRWVPDSWMVDIAHFSRRDSSKLVKACRILLKPVVMSVEVVAAISLTT